MGISSESFELVTYPDPLLRQKLAPVTDFDRLLAVQIREMFRLMYISKGIGLAANQAGLDRRIIIMNLTGDPEQSDGEMVFINPETLEISDETMLDEEGCLSFPTLKIPVERRAKVTFSAYDEVGIKMVYEAEEVFSRCYQHELDHIDGITFIDRLTPTQRAEVSDQLKELEAAYAARSS